MRMPNIIGGLIVIIISVFMFWATFDFPSLEMQDTGPGFMPRIYCIFLMILGVILIVQGLREKSESKNSKKSFLYALAAMGFVFVYLLLIPFVGFYISTTLFVFGLLLFSKVRNKIALFSLSIGVSVFIFVLFEELLKVSIPLGSLFS